MSQYQRIEHTFSPVYDEHSKILILGSLPSVKSRENGFYYGHPKNRFWQVIASIYEREVPITIAQKKELLLENKIALWDVVQSCDIIGSSDSSIKNVVTTDINIILSQCKINKIYANGKTAGKLYRKYSLQKTEINIIELPSTSPANAVYSLERLIKEWNMIKSR